MSREPLDTQINEIICRGEANFSCTLIEWPNPLLDKYIYKCRVVHSIESFPGNGLGLVCSQKGYHNKINEITLFNREYCAETLSWSTLQGRYISTKEWFFLTAVRISLSSPTSRRMSCSENWKKLNIRRTDT